MVTVNKTVNSEQESPISLDDPCLDGFSPGCLVSLAVQKHFFSQLFNYFDNPLVVFLSLTAENSMLLRLGQMFSTNSSVFVILEAKQMYR